MALQKTGYNPTYTGVLTEKLNISTDGNIIIDNSTATAGTKKFSFKYAKADNTADQNQHIFDTFASIIGGTSSSLGFDGLSNTQSVIFEKGS